VITHPRNILSTGVFFIPYETGRGQQTLLQITVINIRPNKISPHISRFKP